MTDSDSVLHSGSNMARTITYAVSTTNSLTAAPGRSGNGTFDVTLPTSWAAGQFALLVVYTDIGTIANGTSSWNAVTGSPFGSNVPKMYLWWKFLEVGEVAPTMTVAGHIATESAVGAIITYTGVDGSAPISKIGAATSSTGTPMTAGEVTTDWASEMLLGIAGRGDNDASSAETFGGSGTGVVERVEAGTSLGDDALITIYDKTQAAAGATGAGSVTSAVTDPWVSLIVTLKPEQENLGTFLSGGTWPPDAGFLNPSLDASFDHDSRMF